MKEDEKLFFKACIKYARNEKYMFDTKAIVSIISGFVNRKRLWYMIYKWAKFGFFVWCSPAYKGYGRFVFENMPDRYKTLVAEAVKEYYGV